MKAHTSLWLIRLLTYELNEILQSAQRDSLKRGTRWSLQPFTRTPS